MPRLRSALISSPKGRKTKAAINADREWPLKYEPIVRLKTANFSTLVGGGGVLQSQGQARARLPVLILVEWLLNRGRVGNKPTG